MPYIESIFETFSLGCLQNGTMKDFGYREGKCLDLVVEVREAFFDLNLKVG